MSTEPKEMIGTTTVVNVKDMPQETLDALRPYAREALVKAGGTGIASDALTMRYAAIELRRRLQEEETNTGEEQG